MSPYKPPFIPPETRPAEQPTWREVAAYMPEFVQWIVATYGPLPEGPIKETDYERFRKAFMERPFEWTGEGP